MDNKSILQISLVAAIGYVVYEILNKAGKVAGAAYDVAQQATSGIAQTIADFYLWATLPPAMTALGSVILPGGSLLPLSQFDVRESPDGQVYARYQGHTYQLYPHDDNGNWPSILVQ